MGAHWVKYARFVKQVEQVVTCWCAEPFHRIKVCQQRSSQYLTLDSTSTYYANYRNQELETPLNLNVIHEDEATKKISWAQLVQLI
jgi:hypothetical protein